MDYEGKWHPVIPDEKNTILQAEYRIAKHLKNLLKEDQNCNSVKNVENCQCKAALHKPPSFRE